MKKNILFLFFPLFLFSQETSLVGDVDCNGEVNSEDASLILQYVTSVIDSLPCNENLVGLTPDQLQEIIEMMNDVNSIGEQPINMIGPMYVYTECDEDCFSPFLLDYDIFDESGVYSYDQLVMNYSLITYIDALRFCNQLDYDGHDDWYIPSSNQLYNWILQEGTIVIPNYSADVASPGTNGYTNDFFIKNKGLLTMRNFFPSSITGSDNMEVYGGVGGNFYNCFCVR